MESAVMEELNLSLTQPPDFSAESVSSGSFPKNIKRWEIFAGLAALLAVGGILIYFGVPSRNLLPRREYSQTFILVQDKISQSAAIAISLPTGIFISTAEAKDKISFEPDLKGEWIYGEDDRELIFHPKSKLELGKYYTVALEDGEAKMQKDFYVDEDPRVISVFPRSDSEAPEKSAVTIVFNRPMVPLTTLDVLSEKDIPIEISPATPGKFKWITTRNLQFIPEKRLFRSTSYTIKVKDGFVSMDGLAVPGFAHKFTTRPLRYEGDRIHHDGVTLYSEPIRLRFNQPADLERTGPAIRVVKTKNNENVPLLIEYGHRRVYDKSSQKTNEFLDKSVLEIYGAADRHGRKKFWDFDTAYQITIARAFPGEGDIDLTETRTAVFQVPEIIAGMEADSPRSKYVEPGLFDPEGKLWVNFHEEIDKDNSSIKAENLQEIGYGEKCRTDEEGNEIRLGNECEKEPNKNKLYLKFSSDGLGRSQEISVEFRKIFNTSGLQLNAETMIKTITTYPELRIIRTVPAGGSQAGKLTELKICATNPLTPATEDNFYDQVKSNISVGKWNWHDPFRIGAGFRDTPCAPGEFENTLRYGLIPESFYSLALNVRDDFGQAAENKFEFTSEKIPQIYRRFNHLQKMYNVTSPERTKLTYAVENLEYVNLHICQTDALTMLNYLVFDNRPEATTPGEGLPCIKTISKRIELPKKYWTKNYFQVNLRDFVVNPLGHYILSFSHPEYRAERYDYRSQRYISGEPIYERTFITVTNLAVQEKKIEREETYDQFSSVTQAALSRSGGNLYWVTQFGSLDPVFGARVDVYKEGRERAMSGFTDTNGVARTNAVSNSLAAIVSKGDDSTLVSSEFDKFQWAYPARSAEKTYIYTDRPIYRPGQEVFIKGLYRIGYDGDYEIFREKKANLEVFNSKNESVFKENLDINEYGTFNASFRLDMKAPLGTYRIQALGGIAYIDVEEYAPAPFKFEITSPKEEYIAGDTLALGLDANYYFGVPLEGGEVQYSILAQDYYFDRYNDGYFQFGSGWYYSQDARYGDKFILRGKTALDSKGKAKIEQKIDFDKFFREEERNTSKIFVVNITIKNTTGQSVSRQKSFIVHRGEIYLGVNLPDRYFARGDPNKLMIKSVNTKGKEISVGNISVEINKIKWESFKRQEVDGRYYWQSEKKKELIRQFTVKTDSRGNYGQDLSLDQEGEFEVLVYSTDSRGNKVSSLMDFYVYGSGQVTIRPTNNEALDLAVDKNQVNVGESIPIVIKSPFARAKALITVERGKIFEYSIVDVDRNLKDFIFNVKEEYIPNVYLSVLLLSPRPEVKYGQINFSVNTKEKEINISVKSHKNHYLPGEEVKLSVETKDSRNQPVETEVSIAVADVSVLALKGNPKKNPAAFFYAGLPLSVVTASNVKNILYEAEIPLGTKGGGGLEPEDLAKKKRGEFKDTAFWRGVVRTGTDGRAEVSFVLPDNLTTWQTEVLGITRDTKVGVGYQEFVARKELMVTPLRPRFIIPGDEFMIGAKIFNQTGETQKLDVSIISPTLEFGGGNKRSVKLNAGDTETVYFTAKAPEFIQDGAHAFTVSAKNNTYDDTVENSIATKRNDTYEAVSTAYFTADPKAREYVFLPENIVKDKGGVEVKTSATLAVFLSDALNYLTAFPYGCSEQIASKLSSIAIVKRGLDLKNVGDKFTLKDIEFEGQKYTIDDVVEIGLTRIYANQSSAGGFAYYPNLQPNFHLTLHIVNTLEDLRRAGYSINQSILDRAAQYLYNQIVSDYRLNQDKNLVILTAYTIGRLPGYRAENNTLAGKINEIINDKKFIREDISNIALAHLAILLTKGYAAAVRNEVFTILENRITIDGRGAFLVQPKNQWLWDYYETPVKDTALLLKALVADRRQNPVIDKVLRWILRSRAKDGAWGSTNNTVSVIDALTDFLEWKRETESEFMLSLDLNGTEKMKYVFDKDTILNTFETFLPTKDFNINTMNILDFRKNNRNNLANTFYYDMLLKYFLPIDVIPPRDEGFAISREFYRLDDEENIGPLAEAKVGDVLKGHLTIVVPKDRNFVSIEDFIPAGMEIVNLKLATEDQSLRGPKQENPYFQDYFDGGRGAKEVDNTFTQTFYSPSEIEGLPYLKPKNYPSTSSGNNLLAIIKLSFNNSWRNLAAMLSFSGFGIDAELDDDEYSPKERNKPLFADAEESHDDRLFLFKERLQAGVYEFDYFVRALIPGKYHHLPAVASEMYFPENFGRTRGEYFIISNP